MSTDRLIDTDDTGFFARTADTGVRHVYRVRWNRKRTARYAEELTPPRQSHPTVACFDYRGQAPLHDLTVGDALASIALLRHLAAWGPYDQCAFRTHDLDTATHRTLGVCRYCAARDLGLGDKALEVLATRLSPPPDGGQPGPAAVTRGHLRLVAAYGRLIEAA